MQHCIGQSADVREAVTIIQITKQRYRAKLAYSRAFVRIAHQGKHPITLSQQGYRSQRNIAAANNQQSSHGMIMR